MPEALYEIPNIYNANVIELIWLLSGIVAMFFTLKHMRELFFDWNLEKSSNNKSLTKIAWGYCRREIIRFVQGLCITVIGIYSSITPPAFKGHDYISPIGIILTLVLVLLASLITTQSLMDWKTRNEVGELIKKGINGDLPH